jgi:UDP-perosamine 4-acetyltransferase
MGVEIFGDDTWLDNHQSDSLHVVVGIGSSGSLTTRMNVYQSLLDRGLQVVGATHVSTIIGSNCRIDNTAQILPGCVINNSTQISANVVLYTGSIVEHDCVIEDHTYVSPGVTLCGGVHVGARSFLGARATVLPGVRIGSDAVVGAGAVVTRDVANGVTVTGVPAKVVDSTQ